MNVLINGASGYIGYHLTKSMLDAGHSVYAVCRRSTGHLDEFSDNERLHTITTSQDKLKDKIYDPDIQVWYQLLWDGALGEKRTDPVLQITNEILYVNALKTAEKIGCKKIIFTGTVYEKFYDDIISGGEFNKHSFYIISKKHAHDMTFQLSKNMKIDYIWTQFCHPVGKYMNRDQLFPYAINAFKNNLPTSFGSCNNWFDIISVKYLADCLRILGEKETDRNLYYIGSGDPKRLREYIEEAAEICEYSLPIGFGERPDDGLIFRKEWFDTTEFEQEANLMYDEDSYNVFENIKNIIIGVENK